VDVAMGMGDNPFFTPTRTMTCLPVGRIELPRTAICQQGKAAVFMYLLLEATYPSDTSPTMGASPDQCTRRCIRWSSVIEMSPTRRARSPPRGAGAEARWASGDVHPLSRDRAADPGLAEAVSPRWVNARAQIRGLLHRGVFVET
jgi:hypothetical protein